MKSKKDIKLKYYLRGLGTGIVITTLVLTISFNVRSCTAKDNKEETTTKEISNEEKTTKETTADEKTTKDTSKDKSTEEKTTKEKTTKETTTKETTTEEETTEKQTEEKTTEEKKTEESTTQKVVPNQKAILTISSGMSSERVSAELEQAGIVESADEFNKYLYQMGYERILRVGTYEIEAGTSYEEIARIITN